MNLKSKISKEKYAIAANALSAAKVESVKDKKGDTVPNSKSLLMREVVDGIEGLTGAEKKAAYEALGIGKAVAAMSSWEFKIELENLKKLAKKS